MKYSGSTLSSPMIFWKNSASLLWKETKKKKNINGCRLQYCLYVYVHWMSHHMKILWATKCALVDLYTVLQSRNLYLPVLSNSLVKCKNKCIFEWNVWAWLKILYMTLSTFNAFLRLYWQFHLIRLTCKISFLRNGVVRKRIFVIIFMSTGATEKSLLYKYK